MASLSRRQIAGYVAKQIAIGRNDVIQELAAFLLEEGRVKEIDALVMDIETALLEYEIAIAEVSSARGLGESARPEIAENLKTALQAREVYIREHIDPSLLGGFMVRTADHELNSTLIGKLDRLRALKV